VVVYCPETGDIIWIDFDPQKGREQAGRRPALILTDRAYNELTTLCIACPITSRSRGWSFEVAIPDGYPVTGVILADHAKSTSWHERGAQFLCAAPSSVLDEVRNKLTALLQI
jgi:mRNA interferase MazF